MTVQVILIKLIVKLNSRLLCQSKVFIYAYIPLKRTIILGGARVGAAVGASGSNFSNP